MPLERPRYATGRKIVPTGPRAHGTFGECQRGPVASAHVIPTVLLVSGGIPWASGGLPMGLYTSVTPPFVAALFLLLCKREQFQETKIDFSRKVLLPAIVVEIKGMVGNVFD